MYYEWWISNVKLKWQSIFYQCQFPTQPNMIDKFQCKCMNEAAQIQCKWNMVKLCWRVSGNIFSTRSLIKTFFFSYIGLSRGLSNIHTHKRNAITYVFCKSWNENQTVFLMYMIWQRDIFKCFHVLIFFKFLQRRCVIACLGIFGLRN